MRLVVATPLYPPEIGGPATYAQALCDGLPSRGIAVVLVKFGEVRHLPKLVRHIAYYFRVRRALRGADAVLALDPVSVGLPAALAAHRAKKPLVVKVVGDYAWEQGRQRFGVTLELDAFVHTSRVPLAVHFLRRVQQFVAARAEHIIVPSTYLKSIVTAWGVPPEKIEVIFNAVPIEKIGQAPEAVAHLPRPLVVTAGRLVPWKNMPGVVDAVAGVMGASLAIVGDGPLRREVEAHAEVRLAERAVCTGLLSHEDTLAVVQSADLFVLNSSYEGLSHLLVEALTLGTPIVATSVGGNGEVVTDGEDGILVELGSVPALANAIAQVVGDSALRERFRAHAVESAKRFAPSIMLDRTAAFLQTLQEKTEVH